MGLLFSEVPACIGLYLLILCHPVARLLDYMPVVEREMEKIFGLCSEVIWLLAVLANRGTGLKGSLATWSFFFGTAR